VLEDKNHFIVCGNVVFVDAAFAVVAVTLVDILSMSFFALNLALYFKLRGLLLNL
jgi:hypothetical protein